LIVGVGTVVIISVIGWLFAPINTFEKIALFSLIVIILTTTALSYIKKRGKIANCPSCNVDLFEIIDATDRSKIDFKYCPNCGKEVEI
jgi:predicted RNA-binding Zn-ribbon protein involved in translation (DUF1610 family)